MYLRALSAEIIKLKHTLALWLAVIIPMIIALLQFSIILFRGQSYLQNAEDPMLWLGRQTIFFWTFLALPLFITLETALLAGLEHSQNNWKHLFALPVPRSMIYATKQTAGLSIVGISFLALVGYIFLMEIGLAFIKPELGFNLNLPWLQILKHSALAYIGSLLLIVLHTWVGLRWHSFVVAMSFGISMTVIGLLLINADWARFYPWTLPAIILNRSVKGAPIIAELFVIGLGSVLIAFLGGWNITRRDVL
ncbi:MAG: ABC transporter permease [Candidatus Aminicenantes bacterium]|nr:ABC transporter permease [Candidatus Aminicenantes bacterium]